MNQGTSIKSRDRSIEAIKSQTVEESLTIDDHQQNLTKDDRTEEDRDRDQKSSSKTPEVLDKKPEPNRSDSDQALGYTLTHTLRGHTRSISSICFSPDGTKLSSSSSDGIILIWNLISPNPGSINNPSLDRSVTQIEFLSKLITLDQTPQSGRKASAGQTLGENHRTQSHGINDLTWSPDSKYLIAGSDDHSIHIWLISPSSSSSSSSSASSSSSNGTPIRRLRGHSHCVYCVKLNPIGTLLISGSFDESIKVWDFIGGKLLRTLPGHSEVVSCLDFSRDGSVIISGSFDGLIRMWDTTSGQCLKTLVVSQETNAPVTFVAFTPNSRYVLTCSLDSTVRIWDYRSKEGTVVKSYTGYSNIKYSIPARVVSLPKVDRLVRPSLIQNPHHDHQDLVLMGSEDGNFWVWNLQTREPLLKVLSHQDSIIGIAIHPLDPHVVVTAGIDKNPVIKIFNLSPRLDSGQTNRF